jgi:hypothetical protein
VNKNCGNNLNVPRWMAILHSCSRKNDGAVAEEERKSRGVGGKGHQETMRSKVRQWMQGIV